MRLLRSRFLEEVQTYYCQIYENVVSDSILVGNQFIDIITCPGWWERSDGMDFYLFSIENKTFEKYKLQSDDSHRYVRSLLYSSLFDRWMIANIGKQSDVFPTLYLLEFNNASKTLSLHIVTNFPCNGYGFIICNRNEICVISCALDWLQVYDIIENSWSIKKSLTVKDTEQKFIASLLYLLLLCLCIM